MLMILCQILILKSGMYHLDALHALSHDSELHVSLGKTKVMVFNTSVQCGLGYQHVHFLMAKS